jgi:hypothetical protein
MFQWYEVESLGGYLPYLVKNFTKPISDINISHTRLLKTSS